MDLRAIVLVGPRAEGENGFGVPAETVAELPIALLDVLGKPVFHRVVEQVARWATSTTLVTELPAVAAGIFEKPTGVRHIDADPEQLWRMAETAFSEHAQSGADAVLVIRVGPYCELNVEELLQFHFDRHNHVTPVTGASGEPLPVFVLSASRRNDAAFLFRHQLQKLRVPGANYSFNGYCNRLRDAADLRRLAVDGLLGEVPTVMPTGRQLKPGVWVADGARIQRGARLLAPAFIGRRAKVRAAAVITRCSAVERHSEVDCGTVVEDTSVLPYTYVGAGLDANHAVLGCKRLAHLPRSVEVEIRDPKLLAMRSTSASVRTLASAVSLTSFLPLQILRGFFSSNATAEPTPSLPGSLNAPEPELKPEIAGSQQELSADLVVARRYGDQ